EVAASNEAAVSASAVSNDRKWKSFVLAGYGLRSYNNVRLCPETWRICQNIPALITVLFSILEPGKHMPGHRGPYNGVLRLHLGLIVPEPPERLGILVENQIYRRREVRLSFSMTPMSTRLGTTRPIRAAWSCSSISGNRAYSSLFDQ